MHRFHQDPGQLLNMALRITEKSSGNMLAQVFQELGLQPRRFLKDIQVVCTKKSNLGCKPRTQKKLQDIPGWLLLNIIELYEEAGKELDHGSHY